LCKNDHKTEKRGQGPPGGSRAIERSQEYYYDNKINEGKMYSASNTQDSCKKCIQDFGENPELKRPFGRLNHTF
jgi:hypothetical protein